MENIFLNKELLIYQKTNSITSELCENIINIYNSTFNEINDTNGISNILFMENYIKEENQNNLTIKEQSIMKKNIYYKRINNCLIRELTKNIKIYFKSFNNNNLIPNKEFIEINNIEENFTIKKIFISSIDNKLEFENKTLHTSINGMKLFIFIWFLNDYDGEIIFWNNYKVNNKKGTLLIYPLSWCFNCNEYIKLNETKYFVYGYLYKKN
jgi:hypothetical protein